MAPEVKDNIPESSLYSLLTPLSSMVDGIGGPLHHPRPIGEAPPRANLSYTTILTTAIYPRSGNLKEVAVSGHP